MPESTEPSPATALREMMDLCHAQMERDRAYFDRLYKRTVGTIGVIAGVVVTVFGMVGFNSLSTMRAQLNAELDALRTDVQSRINAEFQKENIAVLVQEVAEHHAADEFKAAIQAQVAQEIDKRQVEINAKIDNATQASIARTVSAELDSLSNSFFRRDKMLQSLDSQMMTIANSQKLLMLRVSKVEALVGPLQEPAATSFKSR